MFDNVALNVVIGLVLIYLLYSLLVTIVGEMLAGWLGLRQRLLRVAIERMLNDGYDQKPHGKAVSTMNWGARKRLILRNAFMHFFLRQSKFFKDSFAGRFYDYPSIKYLARLEGDQRTWFGHSKPAYITADNFACTVINILCDKGSGKTAFDKISFCLRYNTLHMQPQTLKHFLNMLTDSGGDIDVFKQSLEKWFNETMDRTNGWYKRKVQFILFWFGFIVAMSFNVDSIRITRILANDREARSELVNMGVALSKDSAQLMGTVHADGSTPEGRTILDTGFSRVSRDISQANLILGLGWGFEKLHDGDVAKVSHSKSPAAYALLLPWLRNYGVFKKYADALGEQIRDSLVWRDTLLTQIGQYMIDTAAQKIEIGIQTQDTGAAKTGQKIPETKPQMTVVDSLKRLYKETIRKLDQDRLLLRQDTLHIARLRLTRMQPLNQVRYVRALTDSLTGVPFSTIDSFDAAYSKKDIKILVYGQTPYGLVHKILYVVSHSRKPLRLLGFILTALALSLGAPFWFGVLNKLVSLRSAGVKPEDKPVTLPGDDNGDANPDGGVAIERGFLLPGDAEKPVDTALRIYKETILKESGVISVEKAYCRDGQQVVDCIQINVTVEMIAVGIRARYPRLRVDETNFVLVIVLAIGQAPRLLANVSFDNTNGIKQKGIANDANPANIGSFGCLVQKFTDPGNDYLLTCYHVLNADNNWDSVVKQAIIDGFLGQVATSFEGYLNNAMDIGLAPVTDPAEIAFYKSNPAWTNPVAPKDVTIDDVLNTIVTIQGYKTARAIGMVVNHSKPQTYDYPLSNQQTQTQEIDDLFIISHQQDGHPEFVRTQIGDSGAMVLDKNNNLLGFVVAGDLIHTYAMKATTIFGRLGLQLDKPNSTT